MKRFISTLFNKTNTYIFLSLFIFLLYGVTEITAREKYTVKTKSLSEIYNLQAGAHNIGNISIIVKNYGKIGRRFWEGLNDFHTGEGIWKSCEYPKNSQLDYFLEGMLWVGAVVGNDTLVSSGRDYGYGLKSLGEFSPGFIPDGDMLYRSTLELDDNLKKDAVSEQDFIAVYTDTFLQVSYDEITRMPHKPLHLEITQKSYA